MGSLSHETRPVKIWADVDCGIAEAVAFLNEIPGVRTFASCQGTIGEGGPEPYRAQILASWPEEATVIIEKHFEIGRRFDGSAYLHLREAD